MREKRRTFYLKPQVSYSSIEMINSGNYNYNYDHSYFGKYFKNLLNKTSRGS